MKSEEARSVRAHNTTQHRHACFALNDAIQILLRTSTSAFCIASCLFFTHSFHSLIPSSCSGQWAQSGRASRLQRASLVVHHVFLVLLIPQRASLARLMLVDGFKAGRAAHAAKLESTTVPYTEYETTCVSCNGYL